MSSIHFVGRVWPRMSWRRRPMSCNSEIQWFSNATRNWLMWMDSWKICRACLTRWGFESPIAEKNTEKMEKNKIRSVIQYALDDPILSDDSKSWVFPWAPAFLKLGATILTSIQNIVRWTISCSTSVAASNGSRVRWRSVPNRPKSWNLCKTCWRMGEWGDCCWDCCWDESWEFDLPIAKAIRKPHNFTIAMFEILQMG